MSGTRSGYGFSVFVAALVAVFAFSAINPANAQERKSIRWATSSTGSYGYKVAAQMVKVLEDALGGEYTVTVNPYPSTTAAMKATMDGEAEIGYTADVGMDAMSTRARAASRITSPPSRRWSTPGMRTRWSRSWPCTPRRPASSSPGATSAASRCSSPPPAS